MKKIGDLLGVGWILFVIAMLFQFLERANQVTKIIGLIGVSIIGIVELYYLWENWLK
jgi:hypothetical protein